jgi:colicin import membrane protein
MKKPITRSIGRLESIKTADQKLPLPIVLSFMGHLIFCLLFIGLPDILPDSRTTTSIINVQLVSPSVPLPEMVSTPQQEAPAPKAAPVVEQPEPEIPTPKAAVSTAEKPKEAVSLAPKEIEKKRSMKKKTYKRERLIESAIKRVEKRVEESKADSKQEALDQIRAELKERESQAAADDSDATANASMLSGEGKPTSDIQRIYQAEVAYNIQKNWAFSDQLAGGEKNLYNEVVIVIQRSGTIEDIWFDRRSGNSYFDESTRKALLKSSPLPPIPDGIKGTSLTLGFRFIPEGLK